MTQLHPRINIGLQYIRNTSEYIPKLQFHQHSLLTRKAFSRHNLSTQVFFFVPSRSSYIRRHVQVIFIFKLSSSSSIHHQFQIITQSGSSSLDLDHPLTWIISRALSLDLDHPLIWIISTGSSTLNLHGCYLMILLIIGSSTEPALFHVGCRPTSLQVFCIPYI